MEKPRASRLTEYQPEKIELPEKLLELDNHYLDSFNKTLHTSEHGNILTQHLSSWNNLSKSERHTLGIAHIKFIYSEVIRRPQPIIEIAWKGNFYHCAHEGIPDTIEILQAWDDSSYKYFFSTIHHEITHGRQHYFIEEVPENPLAIQMEAEFRSFINPNDYTGYRNQLVERHARSCAEKAVTIISSLT